MHQGFLFENRKPNYLRVVKKRNTIKILSILLAVYCLIGAALYFFQEKILFHPVKIPDDKPYEFNTRFKELNIIFDEQTNFNIVQFLPDSLQPAKGVVLYFHGNKENIIRYAPFANNFTSKGYEVWMCDYPGFGKSTGVLSEEILYQEAVQMYKLARTKYREDSIVIYGKSMGTGIAAYLASNKNCKKLILETPYYSMHSLINRYAWMFPMELLMHYQLPTYKYLKNVVAPVSIFHGTNDGVVPYSNATQLNSVMKAADEWIEIKNGEHNNLNDFPLYQHKLDSLLK